MVDASQCEAESKSSDKTTEEDDCDGYAETGVVERLFFDEVDVGSDNTTKLANGRYNRDGDTSLDFTFKDVGNPCHHRRSGRVETGSREEDAEKCNSGKTWVSSGTHYDSETYQSETKSGCHDIGSLLDSVGHECEDNAGQASEQVRWRSHPLSTSSAVAEIVDDGWHGER